MPALTGSHLAVSFLRPVLRKQSWPPASLLTLRGTLRSTTHASPTATDSAESVPSSTEVLTSLIARDCPLRARAAGCVLALHQLSGRVDVVVRGMLDVDPEDLSSEDVLLLVASTYTDGRPPQPAKVCQPMHSISDQSVRCTVRVRLTAFCACGCCVSLASSSVIG